MMYVATLFVAKRLLTKIKLVVLLMVIGLLLLKQESGLAQQDSLQYGKIAIDGKRWYQINNTSNGLQELFDGNLYKNPQSGYALMLDNWDAWYPVLPGEKIIINKIKLYDWEGIYTDKPLTIYAVDDQWKRTPIATFTGSEYNRWVGPDPSSINNFNLILPIQNIRYLIINSWGHYPSEIAFYGAYKPPYPLLPNTKTAAPLGHLFGANGFEWNFLDNFNGININEKEMKVAKAFTGFRHYIDWNKLEEQPNNYTFNPVHAGGWNLDTLYKRCQLAGIETLACIKNIPNWIDSTYPIALQGSSNVPLPYGADYNSPNSYVQQAKLAFQFAARYGSNKQINPVLVKVNAQPRWTADPPNVAKIGLGTVHYIECTNEPDKWWKGRQAYQTAREYAANLSAFYDGHMRTLGANVGVKTADPTMQVVMGGTAAISTDYVRGMIDWCKQYRGFKPDGTVNLCWDIINYHYYSNNSNDSQNGNATRGNAPELSGAANSASDFVAMAHQFAYNMPVWITEAGYDIKEMNSSQFAIAIGNKTVLETQADWLLRTSLLYARTGIDRLFVYEMYDDNPFGGKYGSCGLLNSNDNSKRPAADFMFQVKNTFGNYRFKKSHNNDPMVDEYQWNKQNMFVAWIPDEIGRTANYALKVGNADSVLVYTPQSGSDSMQISRLYNIGDYANLLVTETPQFIVPYLNPLQLLQFGGVSSNVNSVQLQWSVTLDTSVSYFSIERKDNPTGVFSGIATVNSFGNSTNAATYSYTDAQAATGNNQYRIKIVQKNGRSFYSDVAKIYAGNLAVYPNPCNQTVTVIGLENGKTNQLKLVTTNGKVVAKAISMDATYQWNVGNIAYGIYYLVVNDGLTNKHILVAKSK